MEVMKMKCVHTAILKCTRIKKKTQSVANGLYMYINKLYMCVLYIYMCIYIYIYI